VDSNLPNQEYAMGVPETKCDNFEKLSQLTTSQHKKNCGIITARYKEHSGT
jgi:hypothetical protein